MAQLEEISSGIYAISLSPSAARVGVVCIDAGGRAKQSVYLIDSGGSASDARSALRAVKDTLGEVDIVAVILTHSHSDHAGGAAELVRLTGAEVWTTAGERGGVENNRVQSTVTCGGMPVPDMDIPYYVPERCAVTRVIKAGEVVALKHGGQGGDNEQGTCGGRAKRSDRQMVFVPLPGHYFDMTGVAADSADGKRVFFVADALFGNQMVGRFPIPFMVDIASFLDTLGMIEAFPADVFVPSHGDIITSSSETVEMNRLAILTTIAAIEKVLQTPLTTDEVLKAVFDAEGLTMKGQQYFLVGSTIRSFLSYLYRARRICYRVECNRLLWQMAERQGNQEVIKE